MVNSLFTSSQLHAVYFDPPRDERFTTVSAPINVIKPTTFVTERESAGRLIGSGDEGIGLSRIRGSPAAYERARLSYTDDVFYEDVHSASWNSGGGNEEDEKRGGALDDDDSSSLTSVD